MFITHSLCKNTLRRKIAGAESSHTLWGWGGRLFEAGRLLTFSASRMGAYSRWALIRGWALIRINTVFQRAYEITSTTRFPFNDI